MYESSRILLCRNMLADYGGRSRMDEIRQKARGSNPFGRATKNTGLPALTRFGARAINLFQALGVARMSQAPSDD
jgi:hypothetical protein